VVALGNQYRYTLHPREHCFLYSPPKVAIDKTEACCKAARKLEEALHVLGLGKRHFKLAVDIGEVPTSVSMAHTARKTMQVQSRS
jgi:hypothetical protein